MGKGRPSMPSPLVMCTIHRLTASKVVLSRQHVFGMRTFASFVSCFVSAQVWV